MNASKCKQGGREHPGPNYNLPHVAGWMYGEDGQQTFASNCIFCGRELPELVAMKLAGSQSHCLQKSTG